MSNKYVVVDIETTGNSPKKGDKIIQFAAVIIENGKITNQFSSLVNPQQKIPPFIEELTGLNDEMMRDAPLFSEIAETVLDMLDGAYFVAHNVLFDLSFLQDELMLSGFPGFFGPVLDTVELARILYPTAESYKLNDLALQEGVNHERPHQADSDAHVTALLFLKLMEKLNKLPQKTLKQLSALSGGLKSDIQLLLEDILAEKERSIEAFSQDIVIYRGLALRKVEPQEDGMERDGISYPIDETEKEWFMKQAFPAYEKRPGQFAMMDIVYNCFQSGQHALIEAGTGVGKSLAYLIPAAIFSKQTGKTVVISTFTTQLQQQLMDRDIPILKKMFPFSINISLLKGRGNYISLAKFEHSLLEKDDNYDTALTKMQILVWLTETKTGDSDELNLSSGGFLYWNKIKNDYSPSSLTNYWLDFDFFERAKQKAARADLVITNHSFMISDLVREQPVLPDYEYCIIDEGHHLEKASAKYFGLAIDYLSCRLITGQIGLYEHKQLFYQLATLLKKADIPHLTVDLVDGNRITANLIDSTDQFFKMAAIFARSKIKSQLPSFNRISIRMKNESGKEWRALLTEADRFLFALKDAHVYFSRLVGQLKEEMISFSNRQKALLDEMAAVLSQLEELRQTVKKIFFAGIDDHVGWIEVDLRSVHNSTTIYSYPIDVSRFLKLRFFNQKQSVIVTSATLTVKNSFQYMMRQIGMEEERCQKHVIPSPFQYDKQVQFLISDDLPEINTVALDEYVAAISEHIISIAEAAKGRTLILFTSHEMLKKTYELIQESGYLNDYAILAQGITSGSRMRLTRNFQRFEKAILLGTSSFWEGIDIPGEDLSCLLIVRLPFSPPDEPVTEAKCESIKQQGGNPFSDYSLPEAVIRFKQGFGRLIRSASDKGVVIVFDRRIVTTSYGRAFLQSIPPLAVKKCSLNQMVRLIKEWL
jgi:ATP-dependent DNA helicase DinG